MGSRLIVGTRGSKLALIQTEQVVNQLRETNPDCEVSIRRIVTVGDKNRQVKLENMPGIGVFVKELEEALLDGRIDIAVHSLKDMPTQISAGLQLIAVTERYDSRDILISRGEKLNEMAPGAKIGTGSLRRAVQLKLYRSDLETCSIRGNVDTRMRKVTTGEVDGVILAAAALQRLGWKDRVIEYLPLNYFLPAVGQGALAIEARAGNEEINRVVVPVNHLPTWQSTTAERAFLKALGGGCRAPIAALAEVEGNILKLDGMVADVKKRRMIRDAETGNVTDPEEVGVKLAHKLLDMGAGEFIAEVRGG